MLTNIQMKMKCIWQGGKSTNESKWMETALHDWRPFHDQCSRQCLCFASQTSNVLLLMISRHAQLLELIIVDLAREEIDWVWFLLLPSAWNSHGFFNGGIVPLVLFIIWFQIYLVWWFLAYFMEGKIYSLTKQSKALNLIDEARTKIWEM